jgi:hypothetical protein
MEQKIYPLNIGKGDENKPLTPKTPKDPKGKKPSFGDWLKAKKWIVGAVAAVVVIGGGAGAWYMGLGEFIKGNIQPAEKFLINDPDGYINTFTVEPDNFYPGIAGSIKITYNFKNTNDNSDFNITNARIVTGVNEEVLISQIGLVPDNKTEKDYVIEWDGKDELGDFLDTGLHVIYLKFNILEFEEPLFKSDQINFGTLNNIGDKDIDIFDQPDLGEYVVPPLKLTHELVPPNSQEAGETVKVTMFAEGGSPPYKYGIYFDAGLEKITAISSQNSHNFLHTYEEVGTPIITLSLSDFGIVPNSTVLGFPYEITESPGQQGEEDNEISLSIKSVSPLSPQVSGTEVTFSLEITGSDGPYHYTINYGDGNIDELNPITEKEVSFKHIYEEVGSYTVAADAVSSVEGDPSSSTSMEYIISDSTPEICTDVLDNDLDGLVDLNDTEDCPAATQPECNDTIDNDTDGKIDFPNDTGCTSLTDITEESEGTIPDEICDNGSDDDGDGDTDYDDSDCTIPDDADIDVFDDGTSRTTFNPEINSVKLFYKLSEDAHVTVEIIDSDDEVVVELLDEDQDKKDGVSHYTLWWNGTKTNKSSGQIVPDGTYTYKITATHEDYPSLEDTEEGPITVTSDYIDGVDFEDPDGGGVQPGDGTPGETIPDQDDATIAMQNAQGGTTAGTGPGVLIYFLFPFIPYAFRRIKN